MNVYQEKDIDKKEEKNDNIIRYGSKMRRRRGLGYEERGEERMSV